jgi:hypothetical protein
MWTLWLWLWAWTSAALADPGTEIVLVLDNSCSMVAGATVQNTGRELPANDPDRAAVLGALIVEGLVRGSEDAITVVGFGDKKKDPPRIVRTGDEIRGMPYGGSTWFGPALDAAKQTLSSSARDRRLAILFTDGAPSDLDTSKEAKQRLGIPADYDVVAIGLCAADFTRKEGERFLRPLVSHPDDLTLLDATDREVARRVVGAFTESYARVLGSKPLVGRLSAGGSESIAVGRYVTEVMVFTASARPGDAFQARLEGPRGEVPARATGDNGCPRRVARGDAPRVCDPPRRHYQVFRAANDPYNASQWTLSLPSAPGDVDYGIVLRYDLTAELSVPATVRVSDAVPVQARLLFRGQTFTDEAFFGSDDFSVILGVGNDVVTLAHVGAGRFEGTWTPSETGAFEAELAISNTWMRSVDRRPVSVEGFVPLDLKPTPNPVELGSWQGDRGETRRCAEVDLAGSPGADRVEVRCTPTGSSDGAVLTCGPIPGSESPQGQPLRWEVCVVVEPCCGALPEETDAPFAVTLQGAHEHYAAGAVTVPVRYRTDATGFLRCWWVELAIAAGLAVLTWLFYGWWSPYDFDPSATLRIAGSQQALRRASALVLVEQPGGRRGFYRNARVCLTNDGNPVRTPNTAMLVVEAGPKGSMRFKKAGGLERQVRRTRKWQPVDEADLPAGPDPGVLYRSGDLYLRFS